MQVLSSWQGWLVLVLFALGSYGLTVFAQRNRSQTKESFLVANRGIGWKPAAFSIAATWIWAPALFVAAQQGYTNGWVGVFWFTVPNVVCLIVFAFFAARMRKLHPEGFTLSGYVRDRLSPRAHRMYLFTLVGLAVLSFAVQLLAGGLVFSVLTGIPYWLVTLALTVTAVSYSLRSGIGASVVTDYAQMVIIAVVGLVLAPWVVFKALPSTVIAGLDGIGDNMTSLLTGPGAGVFWSFGLATSIGLMSGPFGDQSFWQRAWAVREKDVKKAFIGGALVFSVVPLTMSLLGFAAAGAGLTVADKQLTNLAAIQHWLPEWVVFPFILFVLSGLVSTLDSHLCSMSSMAAHDLTRSTDARHVLRIAQASMVILCVVAFAIANIPGLTIVAMFIFYGTFRASTLLPTVIMLTWRHPVHERGVFYGVLSALVVGLPMSAYGNLTSSPPWIVAGSLTVLVLSGGITVAASLLHSDEARALDKKQLAEVA
jgi:urea-proton symporter